MDSESTDGVERAVNDEGAVFTERAVEAESTD